jgi:hypothetical protein
MWKYDISDLPDYFQPVMQRIEDLLALDADIESFDSEWVHFRLPGSTDQDAIVTLEANHNDVLPGTDLFDFQILCPFNAGQGKGLWLHYLPESAAPSDYRSGVWFF